MNATAHSDSDELTRRGWRAKRDVGSAEAPAGGCSCMLHPRTRCNVPVCVCLCLVTRRSDSAQDKK